MSTHTNGFKVIRQQGMSKSRIWQCQSCSVIYFDQRHIKNHKCNHKNIFCPTCGLRFASTVGKSLHLEQCGNKDQILLLGTVTGAAATRNFCLIKKFITFEVTRLGIQNKVRVESLVTSEREKKVFIMVDRDVKLDEKERLSLNMGASGKVQFVKYVE